jgi:hypothetical protein
VPDRLEKDGVGEINEIEDRWKEKVSEEMC